MVELEFQRAPCPRCGAVSVEDAGTKCLPMRDETGEGTCPATDADEQGYFTQLTPASALLLDAAIAEELRRFDYP